MSSDEPTVEELLAQMVIELRQIRSVLSASYSGDIKAYQCTVCDAIVLEDELANHAETIHNYHSDMNADVLTRMYERHE